jgi:hypothetical protein
MKILKSSDFLLIFGHDKKQFFADSVSARVTKDWNLSLRSYKRKTAF